MKWEKFTFEIIETLIVSFSVLFVLNTFVGSIEQVWGSSMEPNFHTGERILVEKLTKYFKPYERGEVVIVNSPDSGKKHYIKRVVGLPGDIIKIYGCDVFISKGETKYKLKEPYLDSEVCTVGGYKVKNGRSIRLSDSQYLILGDNRMHSVDSRVFGLIPENDIIGRVVFRFWPLSKFGFIK